MQEGYKMLIGFLYAIIRAIIFNVIIDKRIRKKKEFSGIFWGILMGIPCGGILFILVASVSIEREIKLIKDKEYKKYALFQMNDFKRSWIICSLISLFVAILVSWVFSSASM